MSSSDAPVVIDVQNVTKKFRIYTDRGTTLKERLLFRHRRSHTDRQVLKGISFQVHKGEAVGLVGENGCGKSTTLKLLTKILFPDSGTITMNGRVSSLIELGAGFHPDMTGRENIYTNASIFGLSREEIDRRLNQIIDFSELGSAIDTPVRTYSSGMYMRLAFAVAINVDADILLIDEILAVGDAAYQAKCFNTLREIKRQGATIVIVSHALGQIEQFCERSIWIEDGKIRAEGSPFDVHPEYLRFLNNKRSPTDANAQDQGDGTRWGSMDIRFTGVHLFNHLGEESENLESGKPFKIVMDYQVDGPFEDPVFGFGIFRNDGLQCYGTNTALEGIPIDPASIGDSGQMEVSVSNNTLIAGKYTLDVAVHKPDGFAYDYYRYVMEFTVYSVTKDEGVMRFPHDWQVRANDPAGLPSQPTKED